MLGFAILVGHRESQCLAVAEWSVVEFHESWTPLTCVYFESRLPHSWHCSLSDLLVFVPQTTSSLHCCLTAPHCVHGCCRSQMHRDTCCWHTLLNRVIHQVQGLRYDAVMWTSRRRRLQLVDSDSAERTRHHQVTSLHWHLHLQVWRVSPWVHLTSSLQNAPLLPSCTASCMYLAMVDRTSVKLCCHSNRLSLTLLLWYLILTNHNKKLNHRRGTARCSVSWNPVTASQLYKNKAQLSPRDPRDAHVSVEMLAYCCTNNANRSRVSLRSTLSNCHVLFRYLHSFVYTSFKVIQGNQFWYQSKAHIRRPISD